MSTMSRNELHRLIDSLSDAEFAQLRSSIDLHLAGKVEPSRKPRPLRHDDIILPEPLLPEDESADDMIETVRRWRREGGHV